MSFWSAYLLGVLTPPLLALVYVLAYSAVESVREHRKGYGVGSGTSVAWTCPDCKSGVYSRPWPFMNRIIEPIALRQAKREHLRYWTVGDPQPDWSNEPGVPDEDDLAQWFEYRDRMRALHKEATA